MTEKDLGTYFLVKKRVNNDGSNNKEYIVTVKNCRSMSNVQQRAAEWGIFRLFMSTTGVLTIAVRENEG